MKITKRQLKRIIREEYARLKKRGLINESAEAAQNAHHVGAHLLHKDGAGFIVAAPISEFPFLVMTRNNELYECQEDCIEIEKPMSWQQYGKEKNGYYYRIDLSYCEQVQGDF